jgi:hypothetical protein
VTKPVNNREIGRQLSLDEIADSAVVVIKPPNSRNIFMSMAVESVSKERVCFRGSMDGWAVTVINFIRDGKIYDDRDREVLIYEYLGED